MIAENSTVTVSGRMVRVAGYRDEEWREAAEKGEPIETLASLKKSKRRPDVFTFCQQISEPGIRYPFPHQMINVAAVPITSYADWWENRVPQETRKNVRRSGRRGVTTARVAFGDDLVSGIKTIYDESPLRQGRKFWHYGKDLETVRRENGTYLDRCDFIGAYHEGTLIGFIKVVYIGTIARIMQIVSLQAHEDKRPTNALLAKAIEISDERKMSHFVYGQYVYGNKTRSPMTEFKRRNGFERIDYPKYYIPLTIPGRLYVSLGLYRGLGGILPEGVIDAGLALRTRILNAGLRQEMGRSTPGVLPSAERNV